MNIGEINDRRGCVAEVQNPGIVGDRQNLKILEVRHEPEANVLSDSVPIWKKASRKALANDDKVKVVIVAHSKVATAQQTDAQGIEEPGPNCYFVGHHMETRVRIFRGSRDFFL